MMQNYAKKQSEPLLIESLLQTIHLKKYETQKTSRFLPCLKWFIVLCIDIGRWAFISTVIALVIYGWFS